MTPRIHRVEKKQLAPGVWIAIFSEFRWGFFLWCGEAERGKKVVMTGERSQLSQWKPASHLCWPCAAEFPRRRQSRYALQQGGGVRMTRTAAEKQDLTVFGNKISPGVVVAKISQQCCGGLISQKWQIHGKWFLCEFGAVYVFPNCHFDKTIKAFRLTVNSYINQVFKSWKNKYASMAMQSNQSN